MGDFNLKQRIITGLLAGAFFLTLCLLGGYWFSAIIVVLAIVGYDEYMRMLQLKGSRVLYLFGLICILAITIPWDLLGMSQVFPGEKLIWLSMFILLTLTVLTKNKITIDHAALGLLGVVYIGAGFHYMLATRLINPHGLFWLLLVLLCIIATDSGAYFSGMFLGKHLLWPKISPKKTIEGAIGGLILAEIVVLIFSLFEPDLLTIKHALILGLVIAVVGQMGDLIQSAYKRVKGIKDTGTLLPGHGGVLDRMDSWLIVFPFVYLFSLITQ